MSSQPDFKVTEEAASQFRAALEQDETAERVIRVVARKMGVRRFHYALDLVTADDRTDHDQEIELHGMTFRFDPQSAMYLEGASVDWVDLGGLQGAGFKFENPQEKVSWDDPIATRLQSLLDEEINPAIASHGGIIELIEFKDGTAFVHMGGGCQGCGMASATLREGVEARIRDAIPEVQQVVDTTDHGAGSSPYYAPEA